MQIFASLRGTTKSLILIELDDTDIILASLNRDKEILIYMFLRREILMI